MMEDACSIREGLWRMARLAQDAAETLDGRIEDEDLDGMVEAVEVRKALERVQDLSLDDCCQVLMPTIPLCDLESAPAPY
jgi:hypothetical protein